MQRPHAVALVALLTLASTLLYLLMDMKDAATTQTTAAPEAALQEVDNDDVLVELFVMSRCPDAFAAEAVFREVLPLPGVALRLAFITAPDGTCMHGPQECRGNQVELCLQHATDFPLLDFLHRYNARPDEIGDHSDGALIDLLEAAGVSDAQKGQTFACLRREGRDGRLLRESAAYSAGLGVRTSCTVRVDGEVVGVRDGGAWKEMRHGLDGSVERWQAYLRSLRAGRRRGGPAAGTGSDDLVRAETRQASTGDDVRPL